jgi:hypothetical protein
VDDSIFALFDGICWTDLSTGRLVAMPAYVRGGADALFPLDKVEVDHRLSSVCIAFLAGLQAGAAANAARRIDIEFVPEH